MSDPMTNVRRSTTLNLVIRLLVRTSSAILLCINLRPPRLAIRIGKPEITISEQMLRVGDSFTVNLFHNFKSGIQVDNIRLELVFRETATYQQGTDTRTVTHNHIIAEFEEPGGHIQAGHMLQKSYNLQIPRDGMHTLKVRRNKLEWFVRFSMKVPRLPDFSEEYELEVVPVMAK